MQVDHLTAKGLIEDYLRSRKATFKEVKLLGSLILSGPVIHYMRLPISVAEPVRRYLRRMSTYYYEFENYMSYYFRIRDYNARDVDYVIKYLSGSEIAEDVRGILNALGAINARFRITWLKKIELIRWGNDYYDVYVKDELTLETL